MSVPLDVKPGLQDPALSPLLAVERAKDELRRGGFIQVIGPDSALLVMAAEAVTPEHLALMGQGVQLAVTSHRAEVLGVLAQSSTVLLTGPDGLDANLVQSLADPTDDGAQPQELTVTAGGVAADAAVALTKVARLLPAALVCDMVMDAVLQVDAADILAYQQNAARQLRMVSQARVPLKDAETCQIIAFRPDDGGIEHLALVVGKPAMNAPVLTRLHSECFTGDLLGSLRCDCGDQLRGALAEMAAQGAGILLYLAQEGRGIGLVNKLRAYRLQDQGFDTLDANLQLGFDDDERVYAPAAQILKLLGVSSVRLLTNNPLKVEALQAHGVVVAERVAHVFPSNDHNAGYLQTKATRGGHLF